MEYPKIKTRPVEVVVLSVAWVLIGYMLGYSVHGDEVLTPKPCEEMYEFNWSFQQCLKHGATCARQITIEGFGVYHENRHALAERCSDTPGDFLPDHANANEGMQE